MYKILGMLSIPNRESMCKKRAVTNQGKKNIFMAFNQLYPGELVVVSWPKSDYVHFTVVKYDATTCWFELISVSLIKEN